MQDALALAGALIVFALIVALPAMAVTFTEHLQGLPGPPQLALLFGILIVVGVAASLPVVSVVAAALLLAIGLAWLSGRYALHGLRYERSIVPPRLFPGDEAVLTTRIRNEKPLPLAWFSLVDPIWLGVLRGRRDLAEILQFSGGVVLQQNFEHALVNRGAVGPFQELVRTYRVTARRRGIYALGPANVESGDPFGIFREEGTIGTWQEIVVYPHIYRQEEIDLSFREAIGEIASTQALIEDPILIAGSREYRPGDPLRRVDWKASARTRGLRIRVADPSTTAKLMIVLNLNTFRHMWQGMDLERMEEAIRVAGSLAVWALDKGLAVGLHSNGIMADSRGDKEAARIAPSAHPRQKTILLDHLARLAFAGRFSLEHVVLEEARHLRSGTSIVVVTTVMTPELESALTARQLAGRISVVYCGSAAGPLLRGVPTHVVAPRPEVIRAVS